MAYIEPKTDWEPSDYITPADYNRIKNNLIYVNDLFNEAFEEYIFEPGEDIGIDEWFKASKFNMFEDCVENFQRSGTVITYGERSYYSDNGHLPDYNQLNRLEKCTKDYAELDIEIHVTSVELNPSSLSVPAAAGTHTVQVNVLPSNATDKSWIIDYTAIYNAVKTNDTTVTVTIPDGADPRDIGSFTVRTTDGNKTATCQVQVTGINISSISSDKSSITLTSFDASYYNDVTFNLTILPSNATSKKLVFENMDNLECDANIYPDYDTYYWDEPYMIVKNIPKSNTSGNYRFRISAGDGGGASVTVTIRVP